MAGDFFLDLGAIWRAVFCGSVVHSFTVPQSHSGRRGGGGEGGAAAGRWGCARDSIADRRVAMAEVSLGFMMRFGGGILCKAERR
jgi:hypothetical protein